MRLSRHEKQNHEIDHLIMKLLLNIHPVLPQVHQYLGKIVSRIVYLYLFYPFICIGMGIIANQPRGFLRRLHLHGYALLKLPRVFFQTAIDSFGVPIPWGIINLIFQPLLRRF